MSDRPVPSNPPLQGLPYGKANLGSRAGRLLSCALLWVAAHWRH